MVRVADSNGLMIKDDDNIPIFIMKEIVEEKNAQIFLKGDIVIKVSNDFEDELISIALICDRVEIDFSELNSISSAGMKSLLRIQQILDKRNNTSLRLKRLSSDVLEEFNEIGFIDLFDIES